MVKTKKSCDLDLGFLQKLVGVRRDYGIRKAKKSNDTDRRRITKLVLDTFLRHHSLQNSTSVNDFQIYATAIELGVYQRLKDLNLTCEENIDEEVRLESCFKNKQEARKFALKLGCEQFVRDQENPEDIVKCGKLLDKIMIILKGGKYARTKQSEEVSEPLQREIDNIGDIRGIVRL